MKYSFSKQKAIGDRGEATIMAYFSPDWLITKASFDQQKEGIDFIFQHRARGIIRTIELKTDTRASDTGNAFVETYSDFPSKQGWVYTCNASYLFYHLPQDCLIYVFHPKTLKQVVTQWVKKYPSRDIQNKSWVTKGLLIPLHEFEKHCNQVIVL
jgi:hypothetical protein